MGTWIVRRKIAPVMFARAPWQWTTSKRSSSIMRASARMLAATPQSITTVSMPSSRASCANGPSIKQTSRTVCVLPKPSSSDSTCVFAPPTSPPEMRCSIFISINPNEIFLVT